MYERFIYLLLALEKCCAQFIVMNLCAVRFKLLSRQFKKIAGLTETACPFGDLSPQGVAGKQQQWDASLLRQDDNFICISLCLTYLMHLQRQPAEQHEAHGLERRCIQLLEAPHGFDGVRTRFRSTTEREHYFRDVEIENGLPI